MYSTLNYHFGLSLVYFLGNSYTSIASDLSYVYFDNVKYVANASNVIQMSWPILDTAFTSPNLSDSAGFSGLDWTKPFPGDTISGYTTHLQIAYDVPFPPAITTENVTTDVAAVTFGIPRSMKKNGVPLPMHSSFHICQHYYVSTLPDPTKGVKHDCSFLPTQCQADLKAEFSQNWGAFESDSGSMCGGYALDTITSSCQGTLGVITSDVIGFGSSFFANPDAAKSVAVDEVGQYSWMIGNGYNHPYSQASHYAASNRTYIVATVFGYSFGFANSTPPVVELACVRPKWSAQANPTQTASTTLRSSTSASAVLTSATSPAASSATTSKTTSSGTGPGSNTPVLSSAVSKPTSTPSKTSSTALPSPTTHCTGGTTAQGITGNLLGLCSYACDYDHCLDTACICTSSATAAIPAPAQLAGKHGCPADNQSPTNSDYKYYVDLCEFVCSRGYCPDGACKYC